MTDNEKLDLILSEIKGVKTEVTEAKSEVAGLKTNVAELRTNVTELNERVTNLEAEVTYVRDDVKGLKSRVENVTDKNIRVIAEAHLDLMRKLDDALMVEHQKELALIRMTVLEDEVRELKRQLQEQTA